MSLGALDQGDALAEQAFAFTVTPLAGSRQRPAGRGQTACCTSRMRCRWRQPARCGEIQHSSIRRSSQQAGEDGATGKRFQRQTGHRAVPRQKRVCSRHTLTHLFLSRSPWRDPCGFMRYRSSLSGSHVTHRSGQSGFHSQTVVRTGSRESLVTKSVMPPMCWTGVRLTNADGDT